jgi:3-isopropylmalate/(R)-2-methylmalate dehydratase large subunit
LNIDRHLVHEVTSPQAFEGLKLAGRKLWRIDSVVSTADHNTPTTWDWDDGIKDPISQGIVHVIGPENGATLPGMTVVCGDSHTSTHGAFGALAHGIGTSEVEHVMATQTLLAKKAKNMLVQVMARWPRASRPRTWCWPSSARSAPPAARATPLNLQAPSFRAMSMEGRMTVCNMAIEAGARAGLVAVDDKTIEYVKGRPLSPTGVEWDQAVAYWKTLHSDADAKFDTVVKLDAAEIVPQVTWGTSARDGAGRGRPRARPRQGKRRQQARRH